MAEHQDQKVYPPGSLQNPNHPKYKKKTRFTPPNNNLTTDELLAKSFYDIMQIKADRGELSRIYKEPHDRQHLNAIVRSGKIYGVICTGMVFLFLRRAPKYLLNRSFSKRDTFVWGTQGNPYYDFVRRQGPWLPHIKTHRDGSTSFHEGWLIAPFWLVIDTALACITGFVYGVTSTSNIKIFEAAADIPLTEGRSAVSDALCSDFIENYKRLPADLWSPKNLERDNLTTNIKRFVENCHRRQQVEQRLRAEMMLNKDEPVSIPKPGVPSNLQVELEEKPDEDIEWVDKTRKWLDKLMEEDDEDD